MISLTCSHFSVIKQAKTAITPKKGQRSTEITQLVEPPPPNRVEDGTGDSWLQLNRILIQC